MFSAQIPLRSLIEFCRGLRHMLEAGVSLGRAMRQQAKRGPIAVRPVALRIADKIDEGIDFQTALKPEANFFPPLFLALSTVAEDTGKLPEVLEELETFFALQLKLRRQFLAMIAWPAFQFVAAILVLTLLIWVLGMIADSRGSSPVNVFGLKGGRQAALFFFGVVGLVAGAWAAYRFGLAAMKSKPLVDRVLLDIPVAGSCLQALAVSRFSLGMYLTMEAGTPIGEAIRLSMQATNNSAFISRAQSMASRVEEGKELTESLSGYGLFPPEFLTIIETAEISGQEAEVFRRQAQVYHETAARKLKLLTAIAGGALWLAVAIFLVTAIIKIYMSAYGPVFEMLDKM